MSERVTVAVPVFNGLPHVQTAVQSVLDQTYANLDVVVIDNASTDGTADWVETIQDPRLRLIRNDTNVGLDGNFNKARAEASSSPYWKLVCADDVIYPSCIETEVAALERNPSAVMTASKRTIIDDSGKTLFKLCGLAGMSKLVSGPIAVRRCISRGTNIIGEPTVVLLRSSALKEAGPFNGTHWYLIDFDMWARVLERGDLYAIDQPLAAFRVGAMSATTSTVAKQQRAHTIGVFRKLAADDKRDISRLLFGEALLVRL